MSQLSDFLTGGIGALPKVTAGAAVLQNDSLLMGPDGTVITAQITDYATVPNIDTRVVAPTVLAGGVLGFTPYRQPIIQDTATGNLIVAAPYSSSAGIVLQKYTPAVGLLGSVTIETTGVIYASKLSKLSNGNFLVSYCTTTNVKFCIVDPMLSIVLAPVAGEAVTSSNWYYSDAIALTGGGFAMSYITGSTQRLAIYDNTGAVVSAPATIQTWSGTANTSKAKLAELSNLNIVVSYSSAFASNNGLYYGIYSPTGATVKAMALLLAQVTGTGQAIQELSVVAGLFAIMWACDGGSGAAVRLWVINNAGVIQGAPFSGVGSNSSWSDGTIKVVNDGANFWALYNSSSFWWSVVKAPFSGVGYQTYIGGTVVSNGAGTGIQVDAFIENNRLIAVHQNSYSTYATNGFVFNIAHAVLERSTLTSLSGASSNATKVIPGGDFTLITLEATATPSTVLTIAKYQNASILGVAQAAVAAGAAVPVATTLASQSNALKGSSVKQFDHSTANIYGNKGTLLSGGVTMKGL